MICRIGKSLAEIENFLKEKYIQEMVLLLPISFGCTATGNSGHSLRQDYGIISIYLKGVSDGETKTKKLHLRV